MASGFNCIGWFQSVDYERDHSLVVGGCLLLDLDLLLKTSLDIELRTNCE